MGAPDDIKRQAIDQRRKFALAWNKTMVSIWQERISKLGVIDTGRLYRSPLPLSVHADAEFLDITEQQMFTEYGIWQDLGVGRETPHGVGVSEGQTKVRQRKRWFSTKYYGSVMNLKEFMAESMGEQFIGIVANSLDTDRLKRSTNFYKNNGY